MSDTPNVVQFPREINPDCRASPWDIFHAVCRVSGVPPELCLSGRRMRRLAWIRGLIMYLIYTKCFWISSPELGKMMKKDHSTVLHAVKDTPIRMDLPNCKDAYELRRIHDVVVRELGL